MQIINQGFLIDTLTNSIQNRITGDSFKSNIVLLEKKDIEKLRGNKKWTKEMCLDIIKKCNSKYEIKKSNPVVYRIFRKNKWNIQSEINWL